MKLFLRYYFNRELKWFSSFILIISVLPVVSLAASTKILVYTVNGVTGKAQDNVVAYLGEGPETEVERSNFMFSATKDVEKALQALGYFQAKIKTILNQQSTPWQLTINIQLNQKVKLKKVDIQIIGKAKSELAFNKILSQYQFNIEQPLDQQHYEALKSSLLNKGVELGYFDARLTSNTIKINKKRNTAEIKLHYESGERYQFGEAIFDEIELSPWILEVLTPFQPGEDYDATKINKLQSNLQQSQYFSSVKVRPLIDSKSNNENLPNTANNIDEYRIPVKASLSPAKSHLFDVSVGYVTDTHERVSFGWRTPKINNYGHNQETKLSYSKINPTGTFNYNIPISHPYKDILQLGLSLEDDRFGGLKSKIYQSRVSRIHIEKGWVTNYYLRNHREQWRYFDESQQVFEDRKGKYLIPGLSWSKTRKSGSPLDPSYGFSQLYTLEGTDTALGSDIQFVRATARFKWLKRFWENHRFIARTYLGINQLNEQSEKLTNEQNKLLGPSLRFYAGGDESIRGFSYQSLGPTIQFINANGDEEEVVVGGTRIATGSIEYQYYFNDNWRVPLFVDGGQAFSQEEFNPVYSIGTGIHYISPIGAIRFEFAWGVSEPDTPWEWHFTMGAEL